MQEFLPFIIAGIAAGSIYGLAATGLVLTYKTSGIFNFGQGALATAAAYIFYAMHYANNINWVVSLVVSVLIAGPLMGLGMERISRRLSQQSVAWKIVATTGLILIVQGLGTIKYGSDTIDVPQFLPRGADSFEVGGVNISYAQLIVTVVGVVAVAGLYALFRWTRTGTAMRAVVDDPDLLAMQATSPVRVRRTAWIIGTTFAALSGVLVLPFIGLECHRPHLHRGAGVRRRRARRVQQHPAHVRRRHRHRDRRQHLAEVRRQRRLARAACRTACRSSSCSSRSSCFLAVG